MRNGVIQDWGLVEFFDADEAEQTQERMDGYTLAGHNIRVHYCIPGINAINIHMKVVSTPAAAGRRRALLEDTPSQGVYSQLQKLTAQNPVCELPPPSSRFPPGCQPAFCFVSPPPLHHTACAALPEFPKAGTLSVVYIVTNKQNH